MTKQTAEEQYRMGKAFYKKHKINYIYKYKVIKREPSGLREKGFTVDLDLWYKAWTDYEFDENTGMFTLLDPQKVSTGTPFYAKVGDFNREENGRLTAICKARTYTSKTPDGEVKNNREVLEILESTLTSVPTKGDFIEELKVEEGTYPKDGEYNGYWYVLDRLATIPPEISDFDMNLGGKYQDFSIDYVITHKESSTVKVEIKVDNETKQKPTVTSLGVRKYFKVSIKDLKLGKHTIKIIATDIDGNTATRTYTFQKVNSAPTISGEDKNLGLKNTAFTYTYQVHDAEKDPVTVVEKFNGDILRTLNNVSLDTDIDLQISDEQIRKLEINTKNTIEIEANDGTASTFRRLTFTRNNIPPIISGSDKDLGEVTNSFNYKWSATDLEKDKLRASVYLDGKKIKDIKELKDSEEQTVSITGLDMIKLRRGQHSLKIVVLDEKDFEAVRTVTFTRKIERLVMQLSHGGVETDELATRVNITEVGIYAAEGASIKYEACNNSFDEKPTWEDATAMTKAGKAYVFQNKTKTAEKAGVNVRVTIDKGSASALSYINAIGGAVD